MSLVRAIVFVIAGSLSSLASAAPCAGFSDVDDASPFCADVTWIANRGITVGCQVGLYCPNAVVSRLSMAVFLRRLGESVYARSTGTQFTQTTPLGPGLSETVFTFGWAVDEHVIWRSVPSPGGKVSITEIAIENNGGGTLTYFITVKNVGAGPTGYALSYAVLQ